MSPIPNPTKLQDFTIACMSELPIIFLSLFQKTSWDKDSIKAFFNWCLVLIYTHTIAFKIVYINLDTQN